jgi:hypothetical protein
MPGVRLSLGTGDSTLGSKVGRLRLERGVVPSEVWRSSAAREVTKPIEGRALGGGMGFAEGVVVPCACAAGRGGLGACWSGGVCRSGWF